MKKYEKPEIEEVVFTSEMIALGVESFEQEEEFD